jgi:P27 family predicted phage terminase small subunit
MATTGRKPTPTAAKKLAGNPGKRKLPQDEVMPDADMPTMPRGRLSEDARKFWRDNCKVLNDAGLLTAVDGAAYALMATHYALALEAAAVVEEDGIVQEDERGLARKHPLLSVLRQNSDSFLRYAREFGMTPSSRVGMKREGAAEQLTLADALFDVVSRMESEAEAVLTVKGRDGLEDVTE